MCMARLGSQVRQYDSFTPGKRVLGGRRNSRLRRGGNPHFRDFYESEWFPIATDTRRVIEIERNTKSLLRKRRQRGAQFTIKIQISRTPNRGILLRGDVYFYRKNAKSKADPKRNGPRNIVGISGNKCDSAYYRRSSMETDLNGPRSTNRIFWYFRFRLKLNIHLENTNYPSCYLVDSQALFSQRKYGTRLYVGIGRRGRIRIRD